MPRSSISVPPFARQYSPEQQTKTRKRIFNNTSFSSDEDSPGFRIDPSLFLQINQMQKSFREGTAVVFLTCPKPEWVMSSHLHCIRIPKTTGCCELLQLFFLQQLLRFCIKGLLKRTHQDNKHESDFERSDAISFKECSQLHVTSAESIACEYLTQLMSGCITLCTWNSCQHSHGTQLLTLNTGQT